MAELLTPRRAREGAPTSEASDGDALRGSDGAGATAARAYLPLVLMLVAGAALRLYTMIVSSTVVTDYYTGDAGRYIRVGYRGLFYDEWQPAGYPAVLAALRALSSQLTLTVAFQHVIGLVTGLLMYALVRRGGASRPLALIPAGVALLSGDHLFLEHAFLEESAWMALLAGGLYAAVRAGATLELCWTAAASVLLGLSAVVRNVSLLLPLLLALWMLVIARGALSVRVRVVAAALVPAIIVIVAYTVVATSFGPYSGLGEMSGWSLYTRVGQFADCRRFTPPPGTRGLCEQRPAGQRPGPFFYYFGLTSPARKVFPAMSPQDGKKAGAFARATILHQPLDYARTVGKDLVRYFDPQAGYDRLLSGSSLDDMTFRSVSPDPANTATFASRVRSRYSGLDSTPNAGTSALETYQRIFRINGLILLALIALTAVGVVRGAGYARAASLLCGASAVVLLVLPPAVSSYDGRYTVPPALLLAGSAALAASALGARRRSA